ncbi:T9SS type A sorting domain-containing protein [Flavobacterium sp. WV_118_3]|jgi:hypothetical protein|uniref:T9SS type A sorting domain-containing protein n=1 Tax=Flavobacterium sp. WV_118_3 TaxID=3151764 RepID=UPI00321A4753
MKVAILPLITILSCFLCNSIDTKAQTLHFSYDTAGNQITRELICKECIGVVEPGVNRIARPDTIPPKPKEQLQYYPNPVIDELYLKWSSVDNKLPVSIALYSINGQHIRTFSNLERQSGFKIPFSGCPSGIYSLIINYTNGEQQALTIIKK